MEVSISAKGMCSQFDRRSTHCSFSLVIYHSSSVSFYAFVSFLSKHALELTVR